jgi:lipoprotein-anchoring transpeptidase ErfK/SrfK
MTKVLRSIGLALAVWASFSLVPAVAGVEARIDIGHQRMRVYVDGEEAYSWPVSTGRPGYATPPGDFKPDRMHARYFSRKYHNAPMPYAVFFNGGVAVHGTTEIRRLGKPASHGCVRLHPDNAWAFFTLVKHHGLDNSRVVVTE